MPQFVLNTDGHVHLAPSATRPENVYWAHLDDFTRGYIEALFFTSSADDEDECAGLGFADLAPEALQSIINDCAKFQARCADVLGASDLADFSATYHKEGVDVRAGRDFWYTRNGHGVGFWEDDRWPKPHGDKLDDVASDFKATEPYRGDDGKVYLA